MPIFFAINEAPKHVPNNNPDDYSLDDNEDISPNASSEDPDIDETDDNYDLPDDEENVPDETETTDPEDEEPEDEPQEPDTSDDNYDLPDDGGDGTEDGDESEPIDNEETPSEENTDEEDEIQQLENELFDSLSNDKRTIMDKELIRLYSTMYNSISKTINKIHSIPKNQQNLDVLDYSYKKLYEIQGILYDYIIETYKTKTYVENLSNYYQFIASIDSIEKLISQLKQKDSEKM